MTISETAGSARSSRGRRNSSECIVSSRYSSSETSASIRSVGSAACCMKRKNSRVPEGKVVVWVPCSAVDTRMTFAAVRVSRNSSLPARERISFFATVERRITKGSVLIGSIVAFWLLRQPLVNRIFSPARLRALKRAQPWLRKGFTSRVLYEGLLTFAISVHVLHELFCSNFIGSLQRFEKH